MTARRLKVVFMVCVQRIFSKGPVVYRTIAQVWHDVQRASIRIEKKWLHIALKRALTTLPLAFKASSTAVFILSYMQR